MDEDELRDRLQKLEKELRSLQAGFAKRKASRRFPRIARLAKFAVTNWVLLSFLAAIATAVYVKYEFGVDYFRQYRSEETQTQIGDFYTSLGDLLLNRTQWAAALDAYKQALQTEPYNTKASLGIVKAQVFLPSGQGPTAFDPDAAAARLRGLRDLSRSLSAQPDDQVLFLEGLYEESKGQGQKAIEFFEKAIKQNPQSSGSFFQLGALYSEMTNFNLENTIKNFQRALDLDSESWETASNLGYAYFLERDFDRAGRYLNQSRRLELTWENTFELAEWSRYTGRTEDARSLHEDALRGLQAAKSETDRYLANFSTWNFMPLAESDRKTISCTVVTFRPSQKRAFVHYALSLDLAMMRDLRGAETERNEALQIDLDREYPQYFAEMSQSVLNLCKPNASARRWLKENVAVLTRAWQSGRARWSSGQCKALQH